MSLPHFRTISARSAWREPLGDCRQAGVSRRSPRSIDLWAGFWRTQRSGLDGRPPLWLGTLGPLGDARDALAARGRNALRRFAEWCVQRGAWLFWWDLSWITTTFIGAQQTGTSIPWARPLFEAYIAGAWFLYWTDDTLYWVAKPTMHMEQTPNGRRLHCETGPALESDAEDLYFWHGVLVPSFAVIRPDLITATHVQQEENAEVRRVLMERMGFDRFVAESGAQPIATDAYGTLYRIELPDDEPLVIVRVQNSTPEPDGSCKDYTLRVPPDMRTPHQAVAWSFGLTPAQYAPVVET